MQALRIAALFVLAFAGSSMAAGASAEASRDTPEAAARRYLAAEAAFDVKALDAVLAPQFVEISPRGEVDERDRVLGFYAPGRKTAVPPMTLGDFRTRVHGHAAVVSARVSYTVNGQSLALTVGISAVEDHGAWKLLSAQYTRAAPPAPARH